MVLFEITKKKINYLGDTKEIIKIELLPKAKEYFKKIIQIKDK